jgi:hypothetical protein
LQLSASACVTLPAIAATPFSTLQVCLHSDITTHKCCNNC